MEKIQYDKNLFIWKKKLNLVEYKDVFLKETQMIIDSMPKNITDAFGIRTSWPNNVNSMGIIEKQIKIDEIIQMGVDSCKELYNETGVEYNRVNYDSWVNVVKHTNQAQMEYRDLDFVDKFHTHTAINEYGGMFYPHYTFVYYIQMPDVMDGDDGVLYFRNNQNQNQYWVKPEEDDLIIMPGDIPHFPNTAPKSTIDRIVVAGNVGFEFIKKTSSLI